MKIIDKFKSYREGVVKHIFTVTIPAHIRIFNLNLVKLFTRNKSLENIICIESQNDFDSNSGAFYDYLIKNNFNEKYTIVWFLNNDVPSNLPKNVKGYKRYTPFNFKRNYYNCVAKYIICDHLRITKIRNDQVLIYLTHAAYSFKETKGLINLGDEVNYFLVPSEYLKDVVTKTFSVNAPSNRAVILGYPVHDFFYSNEKGDLEKLTKDKFNKVILWMPTFRKVVDSDRNDSNRNYELGIPIFNSLEEINELNKYLKENNSLLIIKFHPRQDLDLIKIKELSNIKLLDKDSVKKLNINNYRLMKDCDGLISDYSSSGTDFLHLDRPVAYTLDDINDYKVGFNIDDPVKLMGGHHIYNKEDFIKYLEDVINNKDPYKDFRHECFDKIFKYHDGKGSERICKFLGITK